MRRVVVAVALVAVVLASCSNDKAKTASARPAPSPSSTSASSATSAAPSTTQAAAAGVDLSKGPPYVRSAGPSGSGCAPPDGGSLPSGWWAGKLKNVSGTSFDLDLVCWFSGQAAIKAGGEDDAGPVEDDYYVRNSDSKLFAETFGSAAAPATCVGDANKPFPCTVGDILNLYAGGQTTSTINGKEVTAFSTVWLHVTDDKPDYLYMQFTP